MSTTAPAAVSVLFPRDEVAAMDHIVRLHDVSWEDYERILTIRGEKSVPRISYLKGELELMSPGRNHESIKSRIGCLVEAYCLAHDIRFETVGSWTVKDEEVEGGAEADECYLFGAEDRAATKPHLAIEVVWTSGGLDKLEIYRLLGVAEVWFWRRGQDRLSVHLLRGEAYEPAEASEALPGLDLDLLISFLDRPTTYDAIRDYGAALEAD